MRYKSKSQRLVGVNGVPVSQKGITQDEVSNILTLDVLNTQAAHVLIIHGHNVIFGSHLEPVAPKLEVEAFRDGKSVSARKDEIPVLLGDFIRNFAPNRSLNRLDQPFGPIYATGARIRDPVLVEVGNFYGVLACPLETADCLSPPQFLVEGVDPNEVIRIFHGSWVGPTKVHIARLLPLCQVKTEAHLIDSILQVQLCDIETRILVPSIVYGLHANDAIFPRVEITLFYREKVQNCAA